MLCNFLISQRLEPSELIAALAYATGVRPGQVDVCAEADSQDLRDWEAFVLCTHHRVRGDVAMSLDVQVQPATVAYGAPETEAELAEALAARTGVAVLYPDDRVDPETYWLAAPAGGSSATVVTRARLVASDVASAEERPVYTVNAVETAVAAFPGAEVTPLAEPAGMNAPIDTSQLGVTG
ncbi:hypothetical protein [Streptomyces scopuliridis]|uniref:Uncharacterized protein n=1 Tax=Streptomyces scopuliridis RB72 TaxID=1440053 RepID=A0A2T7TAD6_9ACTN|nr:hypothetical protein [Streptomyces scopuliridis]PVE12052.1 hypothetical protein Y717_06470 [Streptomyces scopuliridis RB72]